VARIGIDARLLYYRRGGIPEYTRQLIKFLAELDHENEYAIVHNFRDKNSYTRATNFSRVNAYTPAHHKLERTALSIEMLPRRLDLFHSPDFIAPRYAARKHIITIPDLHFLYHPEFLPPDGLAYYQDNIHASIARADHILVQTQGTKQDVMERLGVPEEKITVHLLGINPEFKPLPSDDIKAALAKYDLPDEYILFIGTVEPRKNLPNLFRAYDILREKYPDIPRLVLGGQPGWRVERATENLDESVVTWIKGVPAEHLPALYAGAMMLVLPSFHEGFGMPAVEAMACGTPVVVTNRGSVPEVVGNAGIFIEPDSVESIVSGIEKLLNDSTLRDELRQKGLERANEFTWQRTAEIALQTYQKLLD
jgi:glycosyltransferase involved in cell wall biosynthesis